MLKVRAWRLNGQRWGVAPDTLAFFRLASSQAMTRITTRARNQAALCTTIHNGKRADKMEERRGQKQDARSFGSTFYCDPSDIVHHASLSLHRKLGRIHSDPPQILLDALPQQSTLNGYIQMDTQNAAVKEGMFAIRRSENTSCLHLVTGGLWEIGKNSQLFSRLVSHYNHYPPSPLGSAKNQF